MVRSVFPSRRSWRRCFCIRAITTEPRPLSSSASPPEIETLYWGFVQKVAVYDTNKAIMSVMSIYITHYIYTYNGPEVWILILVVSRATGAHRAVQFLHSERSFASSHDKPSSSRSLFTVEVHDTLGHPLLLLKSSEVQSITWHGSLLESIRYTCPNHLSRRPLTTDSKVSCPCE